MLTCCLQAHERKEQQQRAQLREFLRAKNLTVQPRTLGDLDFWQVEAGAEGSSDLGSPDGRSAACAPRRAEGEDSVAGAATFHSRQVFCLCMLMLLDCFLTHATGYCCSSSTGGVFRPAGSQI